MEKVLSTDSASTTEVEEAFDAVTTIPVITIDDTDYGIDSYEKVIE